ncbi:hypothetical protein KR032_007396 [Drosophila birchii]|nr:hypothetical protein KR032_007396 [Drosophila birchii]
MTFRFVIAFSAILVLASASTIRRSGQDAVVVVQPAAPVVVVSPGPQARPQRPTQNRGPHPFPVRGIHRHQDSPVAVVVPVPVPVAVPVAPIRNPHRVPAPIVVGSGHPHRHQGHRNHNQRP